MIETSDPLSTALTTWPPVTLANVAFERKVGANAGVSVNAELGYEPFKTWYVRRAVMAPASAEAAAAAVELRKVARASLFGAKMVMFCAWLRVSTSPGELVRSPI